MSSQPSSALPETIRLIYARQPQTVLRLAASWWPILVCVLLAMTPFRG